ncbi:hypothetical protein MAR_016909 [Mya arenaria]|uniref:Uncharacterized protein n=1 Tax=Mya arenaria TaxID=6604 RepID=A0ABY7EDK5_MYAAR|nr:hypothetical protein MAR_016909 [Mya arenaria]
MAASEDSGFMTGAQRHTEYPDIDAIKLSKGNDAVDTDWCIDTIRVEKKTGNWNTVFPCKSGFRSSNSNINDEKMELVLIEDDVI